MGLADLHIHTIYSLDGTATVRAVLKKAAEVGLDVISITDHDRVRGSLEALELSQAYGVEVIPGSEISTADGHLLALFIQKRIPKGLHLEETIRLVAEQDGLCIAAHPGGSRSNSLSPELLRRVWRIKELARTLVGFEFFNAGLLRLESNWGAMRLAMEFPVAQVGNSDAHILKMVGMGSTAFDGTSGLDLRRALENATTKAVMTEPDSRVMMVTHWFSCLALRYSGWVLGNSSPNAPVRVTRYAPSV